MRNEPVWGGGHLFGRLNQPPGCSCLHANGSAVQLIVLHRWADLHGNRVRNALEVLDVRAVL